jgi:hypothetical protein
MTVSFGEQKFYGALRYDARGDYVSAIVTIDQQADGAARLADQARTAADKKFKAADIS